MMDPVNANEIYQSLLKNEDAFMQLQKLVLQAEEFHAKNSDYDIIKEYMQLSGNCQELIPYIKELSTCDSYIIMLAMSLLNAVCHIFIRLASDLHVFIAAGTSIVNDILSYGMKTIYNFLKMKQKASRTKSALHLLTSMIALGNPIALQVVSKLNFSNPEFSRLLNRTNFSEDEDVRTAFLNLIVLIITVSNNNTIRQIVEVKESPNTVITNILKSIPKPYSEPLMSELVVSILKAELARREADVPVTEVECYSTKASTSALLDISHLEKKRHLRNKKIY
ncbi:nucleolar pre-ribosomal-associated protein 1 [Caerostris extrusa]|uniref:Nucleolar pre-ribosomal-associated protein 1 n=1 Tax=Caerostris extrusa TaxID=172846 RepID=A0AAV4X6E7_CAEEX|nr:nucleolar pre-ribosomal-associated protein 1 [Caerostris extrusa]